ncbi:hypothetical protein SEA_DANIELLEIGNACE_20 [Arthrobacter phage DanielleIgnace]|nr:hypothetical protein SEA_DANIELLEIGNACE_20 [Arthrobacter phage DanielleIgnace]
MEIDTAVRRMLLQDDTVKGYVQAKVFKNELLEHVDGTSGMALVVRKAGGWQGPSQQMEFPLVAVECWADVDRDQMGLKIRDNQLDKAYSLYRAVKRLMHDKRDVWWGAGGAERGCRVILSEQQSEPVHNLISYSKGGTTVPAAESAVVTVQYEITL